MVTELVDKSKRSMGKEFIAGISGPQTRSLFSVHAIYAFVEELRAAATEERGRINNCLNLSVMYVRRLSTALGF